MRCRDGRLRLQGLLRLFTAGPRWRPGAAACVRACPVPANTWTGTGLRRPCSFAPTSRCRPPHPPSLFPVRRRPRRPPSPTRRRAQRSPSRSSPHARARAPRGGSVGSPTWSACSSTLRSAVATTNKHAVSSRSIHSSGNAPRACGATDSDARTFVWRGPWHAVRRRVSVERAAAQGQEAAPKPYAGASIQRRKRGSPLRQGRRRLLRGAAR